MVYNHRKPILGDKIQSMYSTVHITAHKYDLIRIANIDTRMCFFHKNSKWNRIFNVQVMRLSSLIVVDRDNGMNWNKREREKGRKRIEDDDEEEVDNFYHFN